MSKRPRPGFTMVELLVVVVIIGVLSSIAVGRFKEIKTKAYLSAMKTDLKNPASLQESYYYLHNEYSSSLSDLNFAPSAGVAVSISEATAGGWSASATHAAAGSSNCAVYYGVATPVAPAISEGTPRCL